MAQPPSPRIPAGAVDLSGLKARATRPPQPAGSAAGAMPVGSALGVTPEHAGAVPAGPAGGAHGANPWLVEVNEENFGPEVMTASMTVPVVIDFWAGWCQPCKQLGPILEKLALEYEGRFILATVDTDANPRLSQEIGIQSLPTVLAVVGQQPVPLFQGAIPEAQVRQYLDELLRVAATNGIVGRAAPRGGAPTSVAADETEPELPHAEAYELMVEGDLDGAEAAYASALTVRPSDVDAAEGLARVGLLRRIGGVDPDTVVKTADAAPADVALQTLAADVEVASGAPEAAFARLVQAIRMTGGDERDALREHLLSLFAVIGADDPRVTTARRALASALF